MPGAPVTEQYGNVTVVRDDLVPGGTKARFVEALFTGFDEVVYASPTQGGAQTALALAARKLGKILTLFVAASEHKHPRVLLSQQLGARIVEVKLGFLSNVQAKARRYTDDQTFLRARRVRNLEFGFGSREVIASIAEVGRQIPRPEMLWCAAGSGTLARGLAAAWPDVPRFVVQVGHRLTPHEAGHGTVVVFPRPYSHQHPKEPPFPSDPTYERKAYWTMLEHIGDAQASFWNTASSAVEELARIASHDATAVQGVDVQSSTSSRIVTAERRRDVPRRVRL